MRHNSSLHRIKNRLQTSRQKKHLKDFNDLMNSFKTKKYVKKYRYDFFYRYQSNGNVIICKTIFCKYPKMTQTYKNLKSNFEDGFIHSFGYDISLPF